MILVGNQRGGGKDLARHLMKDENERVTVHEVRGFVSDDLYGAFQESYAVSRGTRCKQHLYSLSLNPPQEADPSPELLVDAVNRAEEQLGLQGQPRAIVFHEKTGADGQLRRHAHAVWCRIDIEHMKAMRMSFDRKKLNALGRELFIEHGWKMPRGFVRHEERDPRNYTLAEWQQAKRAKKNPAKLKAMFQDCWAISDSQAAFTHALRERGYVLARGDRGGVVAVDHKGEAYAVRTYVGIKPRQVKERIKDTANLPDVIAARNIAAKSLQDRLREIREQQDRNVRRKLGEMRDRRRRAVQAQKDAALSLMTAQHSRLKQEEEKRQTRIRTGWRGLLDRITGTRTRIQKENREAEEHALRRDEAERTAMEVMQRSMRQDMLSKARAANAARKGVSKELTKDIKRLEPEVPSPDKEHEKDRTAYMKKQKREANRPRRRRSRNRDGLPQGPSPGL